MVAMRKNRERKRPSATRYANVPIERHIGIGEGPRRKAEIGKRRHVDSRGHIVRSGRVVDDILVKRYRVSERRRPIDDGVELRLARQSRIFQAGSIHHCALP